MNSIDDPIVLGVLSGTRRVSSVFDSSDRIDFYRFTLAQNSDLTVAHSGERVNLTLFSDLNRNGIFEESEETAVRDSFFSNENFTTALAAGTYFIRTTTGSFGAHTLTLAPQRVPNNIFPDPGDTLDRAFNLGLLTGRRILRDQIGELDEIDIYRFAVSGVTNIGVNFTGTDDPDILIYRDANNNGVIESEEVIYRDTFGADDFSIDLGAGTYFLQVDDATVNYTLDIRSSLITGTPGRDNLIGGSANDRLFGFAGNDRIDARDGDDTASGGAGNDTVFGGGGDDILNGVDGNDLVFGGTGNDTILGGAGDDRLFGQANNDRLIGGAGNDSLVGGSGNDVLNGGAGNDRLFGSANDNTLLGGVGNDELVGSFGNEQFFGGSGSDTLTGGGGIDNLRGEAGNDIIFGGPGNDFITSGAGRDQIRLQPGAGFDVVFDFQNGQDKIDLVGIRFNQINIRQISSGVLLRAGLNNLMLLSGVNQNVIERSDFV